MALDLGSSLVTYFLATAATVSTIFTGEPLPEKQTFSTEQSEGLGGETSGKKESSEAQLILRGLGKGGEPGAPSSRAKAGKTSKGDGGESRTSRGPEEASSDNVSRGASFNDLSFSMPTPVQTFVASGDEAASSPATGRHRSSSAGESSGSKPSSIESGGYQSSRGGGGGIGGGGGSSEAESSDRNIPSDALEPSDLAAFKKFQEEHGKSHPPYADGVNPKLQSAASEKTNLESPRMETSSDVSGKTLADTSNPAGSSTVSLDLEDDDFFTSSAPSAPPPPPPPLSSPNTKKFSDKDDKKQALLEEIKMGSPLRKPKERKLKEPSPDAVPVIDERLDEKKVSQVRSSEDSLKQKDEDIRETAIQVSKTEQQIVNLAAEMQRLSEEASNNSLSKEKRDSLQRQHKAIREKRDQLQLDARDLDIKMSRLEDQRRMLGVFEKMREDLAKKRKAKKAEEARKAVEDGARAPAQGSNLATEDELGAAKDLLPMLSQKSQEAILKDPGMVNALSSLSRAELANLQKNLEEEGVPAFRLPTIYKFMASKFPKLDPKPKVEKEEDLKKDGREVKMPLPSRPLKGPQDTDDDK